MRKTWQMPGGIYPPENKQQSTGSRIAPLPLPDELILPLHQANGSNELICNLSTGDPVLKGETLASGSSHLNTTIHAPTSGTIVAIEQRPLNHPSGFSGNSIVLRPDGKDMWAELPACENYLALDKSALLEKIRQAGIVGLGGAGFPTATKLAPRDSQRIDTLILNGAECEPYITADDALMREHAAEIILGAQLLAYILGAQEIIIGVEDNKPEAINRLTLALASKPACDVPIDLAVCDARYPSGGEKQLIQIITGKEVPSGKLPAAMGILVQNVATARAAYRAVRFGEPLIERVTTVVGQALAQQGNVRALIGTPVIHLLDNFGYRAEVNSRIIIGGPMMGYTLPSLNAPINKTSNCVLAPTEAELPTPVSASPCIRCGLCAEACPASLLPQQLYWYSKAENFEALQRHNLFDCIECGACSYVCPSQLPLVHYYRASKASINLLQQAKEKSDRSRQRFEFRKHRLEKAEAEKNAKRAARKLAAEATKRKLAASQSDAAVRAVTDRQHEQAHQQKWQRAEQSAELAVNHAAEALATAQNNQESKARLSTLTAALKQAEQKLHQTQAKRAAAQPSNPQQVSPQPLNVGPKVALSQEDRQRAAMVALEKRLKIAERELVSAERENKGNIGALLTGVEKLRQKLIEAELSLQQHTVAQGPKVKESPVNNPTSENVDTTS